MGFLKTLFGSSSVNPEEEKKEKEEKYFDSLKYGGVSSLQKGLIEDAIKCFTKALELKDDLEINDYLSQAYMKNDELAMALEQLQILANAQPDNKQIYIRMANVAYMLDDYDKMAEVCEKAEAIDKDDPIVTYLHARSFLGQGNMISAIALLTRAIALKSDYGEAYLLRGETLLNMGDVKGADEDAAWLLEKAADSEDVILLKARIEHTKGNLDESISYYDKVVELNPFCIPAFRERGAVKFEKGDKIGAEEDAQQLLEINPEEAEKVTGKFDAEGTEGNIQQKVENAYKAINPFGLG